MAQDFYPFVESGSEPDDLLVRHPARIAVYDDAAAAPRVVVVEPQDVRAYLEEITLQVTQLSQAQGGTIPFMVIREIVENFIHAFFIEPTISILDHGNTIRFSDQGPGIREKELALQYGTTSATEEMRHYIRGVGSGLPYAQQYMVDKGGSLRIEDNISGGTVVTISTKPQVTAMHGVNSATPSTMMPYPQQTPQPYAQPWQQGMVQQQAQAWQQPWQQQVPSQPYAPQTYAQPWPQQQPYAQPWQQGIPQQGMSQVAPQQNAPAYQPQPPSSPAWPTITVRGRAVLDYLSTHDAVGPSDLSRTYGESQPTWTRELQTLEEQGLVRKDGQKRRLTSMGSAFLNEHT